ncbi:MAG: serine/threonine protein kinase, partial [Deltaproteobacteria bacterium]|nr:serine/threonine protein kinase [Deltaproteobacteria bacterium]
MSSARRRFRILKEIAEGGFGKVYLAEQISSDGFSRIVAVKLLHAKWSTHDEIVMRTRDEARLLGLIRHQHIVKVEDLTALDGKCAIVMEYLEGVDLKWMMQFLKDRNEEFPRAALFEIVLGSASALDAAYNAVPLQGASPLKVIHRDIKPSNIFVTTAGAVKVLDFGTARASFAEREAKTQALAFGSQGYMAPERMLGEEDTPKADIFSLGISLYELLTLESFGRVPPRPNKFTHKVDERVMAVKLDGDPAWVASVRQILRQMLAYEPAERPTAAQVVDVMESLAQDAKDTGLRKFCRTSVTEAKAAMPDVETGDPLVGGTIEEDSAGFGLPTGPGQTVEPPPVAPPPPGGLRSVDPSGRSGSGPIARPGATSGPLRVPAGTIGRNSGPRAATASSPEAFGDEEEAAGGSGIWKFALVGLVLLALLAGGIAVLLGGGLAVWFGGSAMSDGVVAAPTPEPPTPVSAPVAPPAPKGGQVVKPDERPTVAKIPVTLSYS